MVTTAGFLPSRCRGFLKWGIHYDHAAFWCGKRGFWDAILKQIRETSRNSVRFHKKSHETGHFFKPLKKPCILSSWDIINWAPCFRQGRCPEILELQSALHHQAGVKMVRRLRFFVEAVRNISGIHRKFSLVPLIISERIGLQRHLLLFESDRYEI